MKKIMVAMSGGVDSSVTAHLLKEQGYECAGCTMKLYSDVDTESCDSDSAEEDSCNSKESHNTLWYDEGTSSRTCCALSDVEDARSVAFKLGMKFHVLNYQKSFDELVIQKFIRSYQCGETPNPCIDCNRHMKFDKLLAQAKLLGYDGIATGHYARIEFEDGKYKLKKAKDESKDQSYVLFQLTQEQLAHILFPLGSYTKKEIRAIAEDNDFINANKKDSQDICFVPDGDYAKVIENRTGQTPIPGDFVDLEGNVLGQHKGIIHYTIGQRKGLGVSGPHPYYVVKIDVEKNQVVLGCNEDLFTTEVYVKDFHWIDGDDCIPEQLDCQAKTRYQQPEQDCHLTYLGEKKARLDFINPQRAITPGQLAVLYNGDTVLGGGVIFTKCEPST